MIDDLIERSRGKNGPVDRFSSLAEDRRRLEVLAKHHMDAVRAFMAAGEGLLTIDLFLLGVAERSQHLALGFLSAFNSWNLIVAAPLVRLQIDNLTRISYVARQPHADAVAMKLFETEFRELNDDSGKRLTDSRLVEYAKPHHSWLPPVYRAANDWVHLSPQQILSPTKVATDPDRFEINFRYVLDHYPERFLAEVLGAMRQCTQEIVAYFGLWEYKKANPDDATTL